MRAPAACARAAILLIASLPACASVPKEVFRAYPGASFPDSALVALHLGEAAWAQIDEMRVDGEKYDTVKLLPGEHQITWGRSFSVSFLVNPRMIVKREHSATVTLEANRTYRLRADRTAGPGARPYFWIEDALTAEVVYGTKRP